MLCTVPACIKELIFSLLPFWEKVGYNKNKYNKPFIRGTQEETMSESYVRVFGEKKENTKDSILKGLIMTEC